MATEAFLTRDDLATLEGLWVGLIPNSGSFKVSSFRKSAKRFLPHLTIRQINNYLYSHFDVIAKQLQKQPRNRKYPLYYVTEPFSLASFDVLYLSNNNHFGFCIIDYYTKFIVGLYTKKINAQNSIKCLKKFLLLKRQCMSTVKMKLLSDSGPEFANRIFSQFCDQTKVKHILVNLFLSNKSQSCERLFRTLRGIMSHMKSAAPGLSISQLFYYSIDTYNSNNHTTIGCSPEQAISDDFYRRKINRKYRMHNLMKIGKNSKKFLLGRKKFKIGDHVYIVLPKHMRSNFEKTGSTRISTKKRFVVSEAVRGDTTYFYYLREANSHVKIPYKFTPSMLRKIVF